MPASPLRCMPLLATPAIPLMPFFRMPPVIQHQHAGEDAERASEAAGNGEPNGDHDPALPLIDAGLSEQPTQPDQGQIPSGDGEASAYANGHDAARCEVFRRRNHAPDQAILQCRISAINAAISMI
jgi:hypothetical protein